MKKYLSYILPILLTLSSLLLRFSHKHRVILLASLSGLLVFLSFPDANISFLAWVALLPLLYAIAGQSPARALALGFLSGFIANIGIFYWIYTTVVFNTQSAVQSLVSIIVLCAYLALYTGLWAFIARAAASEFSVIRFSVFSAALWVSLEYLRAYLLSGFPWAILGYSQWNFLPLIQTAEYTGVYGISFVIVFFNTGAAQFVKTKRWLNLGALIAALIGIGMIGNVLLIANRFSAPPYIKVAVLQGNIDQYKKWDDAYRGEIVSIYSSLALDAASHQPDVIIWPETAVPGYLPSDPNLYGWVSNLARETNTYNIIGAPYYNGGTIYQNASFLFGPDGGILGWHTKTHLVPFGEYVPMRKLLEPYFGILNTLGDFSAGEAPAVLSVKSVLWGTTICSENFFGSIVRDFVRKGAQVLVNQTNDAWFFDTSAPRQHFVMNVFRAIENRRSVVVAGNTGISGIIEPSGAISQKIAPFTKTYFLSRIAPKKKITFYTRWGDIFAKLCVIVTLVMLLYKRFRGWSKKTSLRGTK